MPDLDPMNRVLPVDTALDGDAYMPGLANPVTAAEVKDIYMDARVPLAERQDQLAKLRQDTVARDAADTLPDTKSLLDEIDAGIAYLSESGDGTADPAMLSSVDSAVNPDNL